MMNSMWGWGVSHRNLDIGKAPLHPKPRHSFSTVDFIQSISRNFPGHWNFHRCDAVKSSLNRILIHYVFSWISILDLLCQPKDSTVTELYCCPHCVCRDNGRVGLHPGQGLVTARYRGAACDIIARIQTLSPSHADTITVNPHLSQFRICHILLPHNSKLHLERCDNLQIGQSPPYSFSSTSSSNIPF